MEYDKLYKIVEKTNIIDIPRIRGLRAMKDEERYSKEDINRAIHFASMHAIERLIRSNWHVNAIWTRYNKETNAEVKRCIQYTEDVEGYEYPDKIIFKNIDKTTNKVKALFVIAKKAKEVRKQLNMWNKYAGVKDVICIRARIGGKNWSYYTKDCNLTVMPWYLERVDDYFDNTYCDIYAKVDIKDIESVEKLYDFQ